MEASGKGRSATSPFCSSIRPSFTVSSFIFDASEMHRSEISMPRHFPGAFIAAIFFRAAPPPQPTSSTLSFFLISRWESPQSVRDAWLSFILSMVCLPASPCGFLQLRIRSSCDISISFSSCFLRRNHFYIQVPNLLSMSSVMSGSIVPLSAISFMIPIACACVMPSRYGRSSISAW